MTNLKASMSDGSIPRLDHGVIGNGRVLALVAPTTHFWILGSNCAVLGLVSFADETRVYVFLGRLVGFAIILYAIAGKNRR